jgi:hypothetical protein
MTVTTVPKPGPGPRPVTQDKSVPVTEQIPVTSAPVKSQDAILLALIEESNDAVTYAQSFGPVVQRKADFVKVLAHLGDHTDAADPLTPTVAALEGIVATLDTASATVATTIARAAYATVVQRCKKLQIDVPSSAKSMTDGKASESGVTRLHYTYTLSSSDDKGNVRSVTYQNIGDLCSALGVKNVADYRTAAHNAVGETRPEAFMFEVDGIEIVANQKSSK